MWSAGRRGPLCVRALLLACALTHTAALQVCHPDGGGPLLGEWLQHPDHLQVLAHIRPVQKLMVTLVCALCVCLSPKALGCSTDVPTVSICELLEHLINIFCFYNGSVRQSYQVQPPTLTCCI